MVEKSGSVIASCLFLYLSFITWEELIQYSVAALVVLIPLATILYISTYRIHQNVIEAQLIMMLKPETRISRLINGIISSHFHALIFTTCSIPVLTWYYATASFEQFGLFSGTIFVASISYMWLRKNVDDIFKKPFSEKYLINFASIVASVLCFFPLWYFSWAVDMNSGILLGKDLNQAVLRSLEEAPGNLGPFNPLFSFPYFIDAFKIWSVVQLREFANLALIASIESALVGFLISRSAILVVHFTSKDIFQIKGV